MEKERRIRIGTAAFVGVLAVASGLGAWAALDLSKSASAADKERTELSSTLDAQRLLMIEWAAKSAAFQQQQLETLEALNRQASRAAPHADLSCDSVQPKYEY